MGTTETGRDYLEALLEAIPAGAFVIDEVGTLLFATDQAARTIGRSGHDLLGRSVLSFVTSNTAWSAAAAVAHATDYPDVTMGPMRVEIVRPDGRKRVADLWASNQLDHPLLGGIVCILSEESAAVGLGAAIEAVSEHAALEVVIDRVVHAMAGHPVVADAAVFIADKSTGTARSYGPHALPDALVEAAASVASAVLSSSLRTMHGTLDALDAPAAADARRHGAGALWVEPVVSADRGAVAALALWRRRPGAPSPNQLGSLHQGATVLALAFATGRLNTA